MEQSTMNSGKKYKVGYTCGVFDLFHTGHLNLLERCKEMCDVLIVGVCDDEYVRRIKNKEPVIEENDRTRILNALKCVDRAELVDIETTNDKMIAQERFGFDVLFSGDDWKGSERYLRTEEQFAKIGVKIEYLPYTQGVSTTGIKEKMKK
jgi:glycerol-3-phosphate cytidylyltransferase